MKLKEHLYNIIRSTSLYKEVHKWDLAYRRLQALDTQITKYLVMYFYFDENENSDGWLAKIDGWLNEIDKIRVDPNYNTKLPAELYFTHICRCSDIMTLEKIIKDFINDYEHLERSSYTEQTLLEMVNSTLGKVSVAIAENKLQSIKNY